MKSIKLLLFICGVVLCGSSFAQSCDIYIHGYTADGNDYFGDLPRQVVWDASQEVEVSSVEVAQKVLKQVESCDSNMPVVLRPHSYGAAQVQYILSRGHQFQDIYPDHIFVKVYKVTTEVYAYTGAFQGTPLMDLVCANRLTRYVGKLVGKSCVRTLSTSKVDNIVSKATSPGVPTFLITSDDRSGYLKTTGTIISKHMISFFSFIRGYRNQNDNTLPLYATRACAKKNVLYSKKQNCKKIDNNYFRNFFHTSKYHHTEFLKNKEFMELKNENN